MPQSEVLIVTTGHDLNDGRLVRHKNALERGGLSVEIISVGSTNRIKRFLVGPFKSFAIIKRLQPRCVIFPDPELHLFLSPFISRHIAVVVDIHEAYKLVIFDRAWISRWCRPVFGPILWLLSWVQRNCSQVVLIADPTLGDDSDVFVSNRPNPTDLPPVQEPDSPPRFVYIGDIRASRGIDEMLALTEMVPEIHLDLIGPCENPKSLSNDIAQRGIAQRVTWHGRLPYHLSWAIAAQATAGLCMLHPTAAFKTAIPTKLWEYWAVGIPVLASDLPSQSALIKKSGGGYVGQVSELSSAASRLAKDPLFARQMGATGRSFYETNADGSEERLLKAIKAAILIKARDQKN
ncbi:MAG TPA: glycosyltransferase [Pseudomonadales bacterium]|jgi:glycosyltransferase involved in cell wall biosynthesis|nr:glycosyltransferase [Pseudomonadales bacterium]